jgi:hypothetical protein
MGLENMKLTGTLRRRFGKCEGFRWRKQSHRHRGACLFVDAIAAVCVEMDNRVSHEECDEADHEYDQCNCIGSAAGGEENEITSTILYRIGITERIVNIRVLQVIPGSKSSPLKEKDRGGFWNLNNRCLSKSFADGAHEAI